MTARPAEPSVETFRDVMAQVPAAVSVVTTSEGGQPHGTTISAFMSLSLDPPTVLVSLDNDSSLLARLEPGARAGVNVLTADQAHLAARFARKGAHDVGVEWRHSDGGPPRLPDCQAWIALTVTQRIAVGDHTLVIGAVDAAEATSHAPLIHLQRTFGTHTEAPAGGGPLDPNEPGSTTSP